jgi:hypothetical protein
LLSFVLGIGTWLTANTVASDAMIPANLLGLAASIFGMVLGSLAPTLIANRGHSIESAISHDHKH